MRENCFLSAQFDRTVPANNVDRGNLGQVLIQCPVFFHLFNHPHITVQRSSWGLTYLAEILNEVCAFLCECGACGLEGARKETDRAVNGLLLAWGVLGF